VRNLQHLAGSSNGRGSRVVPREKAGIYAAVWRAGRQSSWHII